MLAVALMLAAPPSAEAAATVAPPSLNYSAAARAKFTAKKYDEAIDLYRKHLRRAPRDFGAWDQLGASYYHTGQPRKALRYLKHVERKTPAKSYNYYYQGLCYTAAEQPDKAKEYFAFAASRFTDEFGARSAYEMAAIEYKERNKPRAQYWLALYAQRYPGGVYRAQVARLAASLQQGKWLDGVEGTEKPDLEKALFRYNKLSFNDNPHYWFLQAGWQAIDIAGKQPKPQGGLEQRAQQKMAAVVNSGIGVGPWKQGDITAFGGYTYRQLWITDQDRFSEYGSDPADLEYFPLRGDLLERRHQFYADFRRDVAGLIYYGAFFRWEFARIGSTLFPSPDDPELRKVLKISDTQLLIPWIGASWSPDVRSLFYLYMRKELNEDAPDYSNKTYEFGLSGGKPVISYGLSNDWDLPGSDLALGLEAFHYEFIYNDVFLDYTRNGAIASAEFQFIPRWYVVGLLGFYQDEYTLERPKIRACGSGPTQTDDAAAAPTGAHSCPRDDTGFLYQLGVYWNWTQFQRFAFDYQAIENRNPQQAEYSESKQVYQLSYTMAFPSVKRVSRFVDRYADSAFTKEAE